MVIMLYNQRCPGRFLRSQARQVYRPRADMTEDQSSPRRIANFWQMGLGGRRSLGYTSGGTIKNIHGVSS